MLTNNPKKVEIMTEAGINIVERVPLIVGRNPNNEHYLDTKAENGSFAEQITLSHCGINLLAGSKITGKQILLLLQHITNDIMQNAVVLVVGQLRRGVDTTTAGYDLPGYHPHA